MKSLTFWDYFLIGLCIAAVAAFLYLLTVGL